MPPVDTEQQMSEVDQMQIQIILCKPCFIKHEKKSEVGNYMESDHHWTIEILITHCEDMSTCKNWQ